MREILFKAKRIDNGEWVYGNLFKNLWATRIIPVTSELDAGELSELFLVNPSTICEFTGLTDKNGVKIFEGDEIEYYSSRQYVQQSHPDINPEINEPYLVKIKSMVH